MVHVILSLSFFAPKIYFLKYRLTDLENSVEVNKSVE